MIISLVWKNSQDMDLKEKYKNKSEDEIAALAASGDEYAIECIFAEYKARLRSKANLYFMVGADPEDVIQEGMIGLFHAIRNYNSKAGASFKTFAELCIKRQIINAVKMAGRQKHKPLNESVSMNDDENESGAPLDESLADNTGTTPEEVVLLADLLDYISDNAPKIFSEKEYKVWLAYIAGKGANQIALELDASPKSIENALQRMKKKVEKMLTLY